MTDRSPTPMRLFAGRVGTDELCGQCDAAPAVVGGLCEVCADYLAGLEMQLWDEAQRERAAAEGPEPVDLDREPLW